MVFKRRFCGGQFLSDIMDNKIKLEIFDNGKYYKIDAYTTIEKSEKSSGIIQVFT